MTFAEDLVREKQAAKEAAKKTALAQAEAEYRESSTYKWQHDPSYRRQAISEAILQAKRLLKDANFDSDGTIEISLERTPQAEVTVKELGFTIVAYRAWSESHNMGDSGAPCFVDCDYHRMKLKVSA